MIREVNSGVVRSVKRGTGLVGTTRTSFEGGFVRIGFSGGNELIAHVPVRLA